MNLTDSDRRVIVVCITVLGLAALLGAAVLGFVLVWRLNSGEDIQPGTAAVLLAFLNIATSSGALLAPSPLSKTSGASDEPIPVTVTDQPLEVVEPGS